MEELDVSEEEIEIEVEEEIEEEVEEEEDDLDENNKDEKEKGKAKKTPSNKKERKSIIIKKRVSGDFRKELLLRASLSNSSNPKFIGKAKSTTNIPEFKFDNSNSNSNNDITKSIKENINEEDNLDLYIIENKESNDNNNNNDGNVDDDKKIKTKEEEEIIEKMISLLQNKEIENLLESIKWEEKKAGLIKLNEFIEKSSNVFINLDIFIKYIKYKLNNFKETNSNIIKECMHCLCTIFNKIKINKNKNNEPNKEYIEMILNGLYEKIVDIKLKDTYIELLNSLMNSYSEKIIIDSVLNILDNCKKINVIKEYAEYINDKIIEDKLLKVDLNIKGIIGFLVNLANNSNPQLKNISCKTICHMYKIIGSDLKSLIANIKEPTLKNIYKEMEKIDKDISKNNIINNNDNDNNNTANSSIKPTDISKLIPPKLLKEIDKGIWQEKKDGIDYIIKVLENANKKILPDGLKDLFELIQEKLSDANKNFVRLIIQLLSLLIISLGENIKFFSKDFALPLLLNLSDKNQLLREDCVKCLNTLIDNQKFEIVANCLPQITSIENSFMRNEILNLLMSNINSLLKDNYSESFFKELTKSLINFLQDKNGKIKAKTEKFIIEFKDKLKKKDYLKEIDKFKPSIVEDLKNTFDRIFPEEKASPKKSKVANKDTKSKNINNNNNNNNNNNKIKKIELLNKKQNNNNTERNNKKSLMLNDLNNKSMIINKTKVNKTEKDKNNISKNLKKIEKNDDSKKQLNKTCSNWKKNSININNDSLNITSKNNNTMKANKNNTKLEKKGPKLSIDENEISKIPKFERTITESNKKTFKVSKEKPIKTERNEDNKTKTINKKDPFYKKMAINKNISTKGSKKNIHKKVLSMNNSMSKNESKNKKNSKIEQKIDNLNKKEIKSEKKSKFGPMSKEELINELNILVNNDKEIVTSIINVHNSIYKNFKMNQELLIKNSDIIIQTFIDLIEKLFSDEKTDKKILKYVTNVLCKISGIKELINTISLKTHNNLINLVFSFVSYEEKNRLEEDEEGIIIWKSFNSIMLHIIDYCNFSNNICILIQLIKINIKDDKQKLSEYGSRCLAIINQTIKNIYNQLNVSEILKEVYLFLQVYEEKHPNLECNNKKEKSIIESVMNLVTELVKAKKNSIIEDYNKGLENLEKPDIYIKKWIDNELTNIKEEEKEIKYSIDDDIENLLSEELLTNIN